MQLLVEGDITFSYPGAAMTPAFEVLTPTANANKQPPSAPRAWPGARTPTIATQARGGHIAAGDGETVFLNAQMMSDSP